MRPSAKICFGLLDRYAVTQNAPQSRLESLRTLQMANADMAFAMAFMTLTTGVFLVGFVQSLGGSDAWIGLLAAIPSLVGILQIPGAIWGRSFQGFKSFIQPGGLIWRVMHVPLLFLPFLPLPGELKLTLLALCLGLASAAVVMVNPIYNDWLAEMVPSNSRGYYFSRRNAIGTAVGAVMGLVGAFVLDYFRATDRESMGFGVVFGIGLVCAALSYLSFLQMRDIPRPNPIRQNIREGIRAIGAPFQDLRYRNVLVFLGVATVGHTMAGALFPAFALTTLSLEYNIFQFAAITHAIGNVVAVGLWGYVADRYGNKPVLMLCSALVGLNPIPWIMCVPGATTANSVILITSHVVMGVSWSGVALCQFNLMLATAKQEDRANYIAAGLTVMAVMGGIAPLIGGFLATGLKEVLTDEIAYKSLFLSVIVIRFASLPLLARVREEGSVSIRRTLADLRSLNTRGVSAMRRLQQSADATERAAAIESVGRERVGLASDDIVKALSDPQPRVRRKAAEALANLKDPRSTERLIQQIEDHPDLLEEETIEALGMLRDPKSVGPLLKVLRSPRSIVRRAAAKALGRLGSHEAVDALVSAANEDDDLDLRRAALQALRVMEAHSAADTIVTAVMDPHPGIRIAAAEAIGEMEIREAAPNLRASLLLFSDEASAEIAYALGAVGDLADLDSILLKAQTCRSHTTRRRCLLGAARLLGVEPESYRLFLLEGMARDTALFERTRNAMRAHEGFRRAVELYASGQEPEALARLGTLLNAPELKPFSDRSAADAFLVAACYLATRIDTK